MNKELEKDILYAMGVESELIPHMAELLEDIFILGSTPDKMVEMIRGCNLPAKKTQVLDLGCGKGAVAISIAKSLGFRVNGYDIFEPFLEEARKRAVGAKVDHLCKFQFGNMKDIVKQVNDYNIVIHAAVGDILGSMSETITKLRQTICTGGFIIIDDGYRTSDKELEFPGYEYVLTHDEIIRELTVNGDEIIQEVIVPMGQIKAFNNRNNKMIRKRGEGLSNRFPEKAKLFADYVKRQEEECVVIENDTVGAIWLLQKK